MLYNSKIIAQYISAKTFNSHAIKNETTRIAPMYRLII